MTELEFGLLAERMLSDYDARNPGTVFGEGLRLSLDEAWKLQGAVADLRRQRGEKAIGYKIGCVCEENQQQNGLSHPVWGRLWDTEQYADKARLRKSDFANIGIEGEFAVILGRDLQPDLSEMEGIAASVAKVFPVIELHNLVMRGAAPRGHELIANNTIHAGVVRGEGVTPGSAVSTDLAVMFDGEPVDAWQDVKWPDDVLQAVSWVTKELVQAGIALQRGDMILTGALGPPIALRKTRHVRVTSTQFGSVEAFFD